MPRRGKRRRIAKGIYEDLTGRAAIVRVGDWRKEKRFPPQTPIRVIQAWQTQHRDRFGGLTQKPARGSLQADIDHYLTLMHHLAGYVSLKAELAAWTRLYGDFPRYSLTDQDVLDARNVWLAEGLKPKTVNNRVAALNRLWHRLDGRRSVSPGDDVRPLPVHKTPAQAVDPRDVQTVIGHLLAGERAGRLRDARTRGRFMVYAACGKRPSEIMRAEPGDVDLARRVWNPRDGKGGWGPGIYLNEDMLAAWTVFIEAKAWGRFNVSAFVRTIREAGWPADVRPYQLRHSVGMAMSDAGIDLADIQQHMGHKRIETTRKHYVPVLGSRLQKASEVIDRRFGWAVPPAVPQTSVDPRGVLGNLRAKSQRKVRKP